MKNLILLCCTLLHFGLGAQDNWTIVAENIDPNNYYGVTCANGMVGLVSSPEPMKVEDVVLNGVFDYYQRGRVSNILKTFNHVNMNLDVDGHRISQKSIQNYAQSLDMKRAVLTTSFDVGKKVSVKHEMMSLRHLPYTALSIVEITAKQDVMITPMSVIEAPNHLNDVRNYYAEIDRPHVKIPLMTSVGLSPSGALKVAASNSFIFSEAHGEEPDIIHEDWDYNMHLAKFHKHLKKGETYRFSVVASATSSERYQDPHNEAERLTIFAKLEGTWMYPPLVIMQPDIARSLLDYRYERLDAAKQNAFSHGYEGAMYPWESAGDGSEDTPVWALTGPFQHHITGDVAWAHWKYYQITKDRDWLRNRGWPVIKAAAEFWASRVERNGPGRYDINNVIGANEWEENIDNNAFTNGMAITSLRIATQCANELDIIPNPDWREVEMNIPILKFPDGTTRENATYDGVTIKQADANLLAYPMNIITDKEAILRDLKYYEPRMSENGPAMGNSVLAALYARLGIHDKAYELFKKSYEPNKVPPFGVISETAGGTNPYFATGAGGMLQAILNGIGGLDITDEGVQQIEAKLPKQWKSLTITGVGVNKQTFVVK